MRATSTHHRRGWFLTAAVALTQRLHWYLMIGSEAFIPADGLGWNSDGSTRGGWQ